MNLNVVVDFSAQALSKWVSYDSARTDLSTAFDILKKNEGDK